MRYNAPAVRPCSLLLQAAHLECGAKYAPIDSKARYERRYLLVRLEHGTKPARVDWEDLDTVIPKELLKVMEPHFFRPSQ